MTGEGTSSGDGPSFHRMRARHAVVERASEAGDDTIHAQPIPSGNVNRSDSVSSDDSDVEGVLEAARAATQGTNCYGTKCITMSLLFFMATRA